MKQVVEELIKRKETISTMESCTGGLVASYITDIAGSSDVLKCSVVTYATEFKTKFGVDQKVIDKYTVYSKETSCEMAKNICKFTNSTFGIGITGFLGDKDPDNCNLKENVAYYTIYYAPEEKSYSYKVVIEDVLLSRHDKKENVCNSIKENLLELLKNIEVK